MITPNGELLALRVINFGMRTRITYAHVVLGPLPAHCLATGSRTSFWVSFRRGLPSVACLLHVTDIIHCHLILCLTYLLTLSLPRLRHRFNSIHCCAAYCVCVCVCVCVSVYRGLDSLFGKVARSASETWTKFLEAAGNKKNFVPSRPSGTYSFYLAKLPSPQPIGSITFLARAPLIVISIRLHFIIVPTFLHSALHVCCRHPCSRHELKGQPGTGS